MSLRATNAGSLEALTDRQTLLKCRLPHSWETKIVGTNAGTKFRNEKAFHGLEMPVLSLFCSQKTLKHLGWCFGFRNKTAAWSPEAVPGVPHSQEPFCADSTLFSNRKLFHRRVSIQFHREPLLSPNKLGTARGILDPILS